MRVRVRFECLCNLPKDPEGPGHKVTATAAALAEKKSAAAVLGRGPGQCNSLNVTVVEFTGGLRSVSCAYCGARALKLFGHESTLVVREVADYVGLQAVEVIDGAD